jgi:hypothetical protein
MRHTRVDDTELEYQVRGEGQPVLLIVPEMSIDGLAQPLFRPPDLRSSHRLIHDRQPGVRLVRLGGDPPKFAPAFVTRRHTEHTPTVAVLRAPSPFVQPRRPAGREPSTAAASATAPRAITNETVADQAGCATTCSS